MMCWDVGLHTFVHNPEGFELVILNHGFLGRTGMRWEKRFLELRPDIPILVHTGSIDEGLERHAKAAGIEGEGWVE